MRPRAPMFQVSVLCFSSKCLAFALLRRVRNPAFRRPSATFRDLVCVLCARDAPPLGIAPRRLTLRPRPLSHPDTGNYAQGRAMRLCFQ